MQCQSSDEGVSVPVAYGGLGTSLWVRVRAAPRVPGGKEVSDEYRRQSQSGYPSSPYARPPRLIRGYLIAESANRGPAGTCSDGPMSSDPLAMTA